MKKLYIKQKFLALTDTYDIYDENEYPKYFAQCDFTFILHQLRIYEGDVQFGHVEQHFKFFEPEFSFYLNDEKIGNIVKEISFFRPKYYLDFNDWRIEGDLFGLDYEVFDGQGNTVMTFSKELFRFTDQYCLTIYDDANEKLCLLIALAVDMAVCSQNNN